MITPTVFPFILLQLQLKEAKEKEKARVVAARVKDTANLDTTNTCHQREEKARDMIITTLQLR